MPKILRQNVGGVDYAMAGCALSGSCATAASDYVKVVTLSDGDTVSDGMSLAVAFTNGNTAGNAPGTTTIYSSDQVHYYSNSGLTQPFTLAPSGCYTITYTGTGNAYTYKSFPVLSVGGVTAPVCSINGRNIGTSAWNAGDTGVFIYTAGKFLLVSVNLDNTTGVLPIAHGGTGRTTAPNIQVNLASESSVSELPSSGNVAPGVTGTLPIAHGGTGSTTAGGACTNLIGALAVADGDVTDATDIITSNADGYAEQSDKTIYKRKGIKFWNYIKDKISSVLKITLNKHIIQGSTVGTNTFADTNPKLVFNNVDGSQAVSLTFSDYDSVQAPASLTLNGNQGGEYFIAPNIKVTGGYYGTLYGNSQEAKLLWGGQNFSGTFGPLDAALVSELGANRYAGIKAGVTIEYSRDNGSTWTSYGASTQSITQLFTTSTSFIIGKADSTNKATANGTKYQLRITIDHSSASVYSEIRKYVMLVSTNGSNSCTVDIQRTLKQSPDTWANYMTGISISGWSGYNVIQTSFTAGSSFDNQFRKVRFIFKANGGNTTYNGLSVAAIYAYGGVGWATPSTLAKSGHLYTTDVNTDGTLRGGMNINGSATSIRDSGNSTAITASYSKAGLSGVPSWLAAWNGYELRAVSPSNIVDYSDSISSYICIRQVKFGSSFTVIFYSFFLWGTPSASYTKNYTWSISSEKVVIHYARETSGFVTSVVNNHTGLKINCDTSAGTYGAASGIIVGVLA